MKSYFWQDKSLTCCRTSNHTLKKEYQAIAWDIHEIHWEIWEPYQQYCLGCLMDRSKNSKPSNHLPNIEHTWNIFFYQSSGCKCASTVSELYPWLSTLKQEMSFAILDEPHYQTWWYVYCSLLPFWVDFCLCWCWKNTPLYPWCYDSLIQLVM